MTISLSLYEIATDMELHKPNPTRSKKYLEFVRSLPSVISGREGCVAHHIISAGLGGSMGDKASDLHTFPLTAEEHADLHRDVGTWEMLNWEQSYYVLKTQIAAEAAGVLKI